MIFKYIGKLFNRAAKGSVLLTDRLTILLVPFSTLALWALGVDMTDSLQETLLLGVAITVAAVVILRLIAASYFVWKDDQGRIKTLEEVFSESDLIERRATAKYTAKLREELSEEFAKLIAMVDTYRVPEAGKVFPIKEIAYVNSSTRVREITNALSHDIILRVSANRLLVLVSKIGDEVIDKGSAESRLWRQLDMLKRLTFRLIQHKDKNDSHALLTFLEIENIVESGDYKRFSNKFSGEVEALRQKIKDPELLAKLRDTDI